MGINVPYPSYVYIGTRGCSSWRTHWTFRLERCATFWTSLWRC